MSIIVVIGGEDIPKIPVGNVCFWIARRPFMTDETGINQAQVEHTIPVDGHESVRCLNLEPHEFFGTDIARRHQEYLSSPNNLSEIWYWGKRGNDQFSSKSFVDPHHLMYVVAPEVEHALFGVFDDVSEVASRPPISYNPGRPQKKRVDRSQITGTLRKIVETALPDVSGRNLNPEDPLPALVFAANKTTMLSQLHISSGAFSHLTAYFTDIRFKMCFDRLYTEALACAKENLA